MFPPISRWPPALRFLVSQVAALGLLLLLARWGGLRLPAWGWVALQAMVGTALGGWLRLFSWWIPANLGTPLLLDVLLRQAVPAWVAPLLLVMLLLVFGGGLVTRVPLYHSNRDAWKRLRELLPNRPGASFLDLGAGFGGPLAHLAKARTDATFEGVEASPLSWAVAALRCLPRPNARIRLGSLWNIDLQAYDVVFAFLSPVPMAELWAKAQREMRAGTLLVSHTFIIPGVRPDREIPLRGRKDAVLRVYEIRPKAG